MNTHFNSTACRRVPTVQEIKTVERAVFLRNHPEMTSHLHQLLGTVTSCEKSDVMPELNLEKVFAHYSTCERCKRDLEAKKELQKRLDDFYSR